MNNDRMNVGIISDLMMQQIKIDMTNNEKKSWYIYFHMRNEWN